MKADLDYLRRHYAELSDEALLEIRRDDLIDEAQQCYSAELAKRGLDPDSLAAKASVRQKVRGLPGEAPEEEEADWLEDAAEAYSVTCMAGRAAPEDLAIARDALEADGIPCQMELTELPPPEEEPAASRHTHRWRLLVPGNLNLHAASVLERDIFNPEFEAQWKTHLEALSDDEVLAMSPDKVFCGLYDRIERAEKAYGEEIARRQLDV